MSETPLPFNGLGLNLGKLSRLSNAESRSLCAENPTGAKSGGARAVPELDENGNPTGASRELGLGWKVRPAVPVPAGQTIEIANVEGPGAIQSIWMTPTGINRHAILRIYWDGQDQPSVESPMCDFFASPFIGGSNYHFAQLTSLAVCVNPGNAYNCFWEMPFRKHCRMTVENIGLDDFRLYYQINYCLTEVPDDAAYFHAQFRRSQPVERGGVHTLLDGVKGQGHYVGTAMGWQVNHNGWWGEGEIKFYMDGDTDPALSDGKSVAGSTGFPTICGTGTEDYFLGSYNFENKATRQYQEFTGPYAGMPHVVRPDGVYQSNTRFALYRWHIMDPIRFKQDLKVTIQALGWKRHGRFHQSMDDISSVAFWYQTLPTAVFPPLPDAAGLEIV
ncbi:glycoside hydrolase family 172 protein [Coraliomargarita parva]|uniref:glycoside hydrolase family 172 protein n=1 Tax=Coraliomargarita parva TaxID=3014050 RepID=UPI0022B2F8FE|nr:glycoside hydrolase family 172 protein [Coraliomargarita parva]